MNELTLQQLQASIAAFAERIATGTGKTISSTYIDPISGELVINYSDSTSSNLGVVVASDGEPGADGVGILDVELYPDPLDDKNVFFKTILTNGIELRTATPLSAWNGKSIRDVFLEDNQLIFTLDDEDATPLPPIPVLGLEAVSVVGATVVEGELFFDLSNGNRIASGVVEDLRGRGVADMYKREGKLYAKYSTAPDVEVELGDIAGISSISMVQGSLHVTLDSDLSSSIDLGPIVGFTGAYVEGNNLFVTTNQPAPDDIIDIGPVANLKGDTGVGVATVAIDDNEFVVTLTDASEFRLPVSGLSPVSVVGARYDTGENKLFLALSNDSEVDTGVVEDLRGVGIVGASVTAATGELFLYYSDAPELPVLSGVVPTIISTYIEEGELFAIYSTSVEPVSLGSVDSVVSLLQKPNGTVEATYASGKTENVGKLRSLTQAAIIGGRLVLTYNDGSITDIGNVVGPKGDDGISVIGAEINAGGDLIIHKSDGTEHNAGFARTSVLNLLGKTYNFEATVGQTEFTLPHLGEVLFFVNGSLVDDADIDVAINDIITYSGTTLVAGDKVKVIAYAAGGPSETGRGIFDVTAVTETAYAIQLEDGSEFTIETETPIPIESLPPGISNVEVLPNGNLQITLTNATTIDAGPTSNAINTTGARVDTAGRLHISLSDGSEIDVGSVASDLEITNAVVTDGDLILTFSGGGVINAGPTGVYVTECVINEADKLIITLSNGTTFDAGLVRNPLLGSIYDFICFPNQVEFAVPHGGFEVILYANGVALSPAALDLTNPAIVKVTTAREENDIVRIVLLSQGNIVANQLAGEIEAGIDTYYGKNLNGEIGFHPIIMSKLVIPTDFVATVNQNTFFVNHSGAVDVFVDGILQQGTFTLPPDNRRVVFNTPLTVGQKVRINVLAAPRANGDLMFSNYARVGFESYSAGGTFSANAWRIRQLNVIKQDTIGVQLSANRIILPAGKYYVKGYGACKGVRQNAMRLFNQTLSETILQGGASFAYYYSHVINTPDDHTPISGYIDVPVQSSIVLQHRCVTTINTWGFGVGTAGGPSTTIPVDRLGIPGRLVDLEIWKVG